MSTVVVDIEAQALTRAEPFEPAAPAQAPLSVRVTGGLKAGTQRVTLRVLGCTAVVHPSTGGDPLEGRFCATAEPPRSRAPQIDDDERYRRFFTGSLRPGAVFTANVGLQPQTVADAVVSPHHRERVARGRITLVPPHGTRARLVLDVSADDADVAFANGRRQTEIELVLKGPETFEEYYRVTHEAQGLLVRAPRTVGRAPRRLAEAMRGAADNALPALLQAEGERLFNDAVRAVQAGRMDDRALYHARLRAVVTLRRHCADRGIEAQALVSLYERASRGIMALSGAPCERHVLVTGFDPFHLAELPGRGNASGLAALHLNGRRLEGLPVRTCVFPVRWGDFDAGIVESAVRPLMHSASMVVTLSQGAPRDGRDHYDLERFAGKRRGRGRVPDNDQQVRPPVNGVFDVPRALDASGSKEPLEYLETTLPHAAAITAGNLVLPGPRGDTCFVFNQGFKQAGRPARPASAAGTPEAFMAQTAVPDARYPSETGSGGGYLSNEVFYRVALLRHNHRPTLPTGHLHLPLLADTAVTAVAAQRLLQGVTEALERMLRALPPMRP